LRAPPALHAVGTATDASTTTTAIRLEVLTVFHSRVPVCQGKSFMFRRCGSADAKCVRREAVTAPVGGGR
jgi:hypothetical protein